MAKQLRTNSISSRSVNPHFVYGKREWKRYLRSGWTEFCSCHSTYFLSVTFSSHSTYLQSVIFSCQSMSCQSVTCYFHSTYVRLINCLLLLWLDVLPISHPNLLHLLHLLYPKTLRNGKKASWSKAKQRWKRSALHPMRTTQTRKMCPARWIQSKEGNNQYD